MLGVLIFKKSIKFGISLSADRQGKKSCEGERFKIIFKSFSFKRNINYDIILSQLKVHRMRMLGEWMFILKLVA